MTLELVRIGLDEANAFVSAHHRHHRPVVGHLFSLGAAVAGKIVGVAIVGRPVSRHRDDGEARRKAISECIEIAEAELADPKSSGRSIAKRLRDLLGG